MYPIFLSILSFYLCILSFYLCILSIYLCILSFYLCILSFYLCNCILSFYLCILSIYLYYICIYLTIQVLLKHGADPDAQSKFDKSPADISHDTGRPDLRDLLMVSLILYLRLRFSLVNLINTYLRLIIHGGFLAFQTR